MLSESLEMVFVVIWHYLVFDCVKLKMKDNFKVKNSLFNVVLVVVCSFVGVGFITGVEIWFYFARFGKNMLMGLVCFGVLTFVLSMFAFKNNKYGQKFANVQSKILLVSELAVASAMVSGLFETTKTLFSKYWGMVFVVAILLLCFLIFSEKKSFVIYNYFVAGFVIFVLVSLFLFNNNTSTENELDYSMNFELKNCILSALFSAIYVFMNISEIRPILERNSEFFDKKRKILTSVILSFSLIFLVFTVSLLLFRNRWATEFSMPFLAIFREKNNVSKFVFLIGIILTMISTAQACLIGAKDKLNLDKNDDNFEKIIVILSSLIFGQIKFQFYIKIVYPILAVLNFLLMLTQLFFEIKNKRGKIDSFTLD